MELVYCGLFSKVFNWVLEKIITPVTNFLADILGKIFTWIFNEILAPILRAVFTSVGRWVLDLLMEIFAEIFYGILSALLQVIEVMEEIFDLLAGLRDVTFHYTAGSSVTGSLASALFRIPGLRNAFMAITLTAVMLTFLTSAYATSKSVLDFDFENRRPVSRVLSATFRALLNLLTLNLFVQGLLLLGEAILKSANNAIMGAMGAVGGRSTTIARMIFCMSSLTAAKDENNNIGHGDVSVMNGIRERWYYSTGSGGQSAGNYMNVDDVKSVFKLSKFDYFIGYVMSAALIIILGGCLVVLVQRIFDMLVLYLVSPYFVSLIPLDDGEKFGRWRELFIGKVFTGFGTLVAIKLYLMLAPAIMDKSALLFYDEGKSVEVDYLIRMMIILGGAYAVSKSNGLVTNLISAQAGQQESMSSMVGQGIASAGLQVAGAGAKFAGSVGMKAGWALTKSGANVAWKGAKFAGFSALALGGAAYTGISKWRKSSAGSSSGGGAGGSGSGPMIEMQDLSGGGAGGGGGGAGSGQFMDSVKKVGQGGAAALGGAGGAALGGAAGTAAKPGAGGAGAGAGAGGTGAKPAEGQQQFTKTPKTGAVAKGQRYYDPGRAKEAKEARHKQNIEDFKKRTEGKIATTFGQRMWNRALKQLGVDTHFDKSGKSYREWSLFSKNLIHFGRDEKGNRHIRFMGFGKTESADGKTVKKSYGVFTRTSDEAGNTKALNVLGFRWKDDGAGGMYFRGASLLGLKREIGEDGGIHTTDVLGIHRDADENGSYRITSLGGLHVAQYLGDDGKYHVLDDYTDYKDADFDLSKKDESTKKDEDPGEPEYTHNINLPGGNNGEPEDEDDE